MDHSLDKLRRAAKQLRKAHQAGEQAARQRLRLHPPKPELTALQHADYLHVIARENGFASWPQLKLAVEVSGMDRAQKQQRLKVALYQGQNAVVQRLLAETPDLANGMFGLQCALYNRAAVAEMLAADPKAATRKYGPRSAILHLAFSKYIHAVPEREADMMSIARMLVEAGADVNDSYSGSPNADEPLSALYGAIGHADNMVLGQWLLDQGANPNDGESLYHACELSHREGLRMLLAAGADPKGTNALLRAMDFHDIGMVKMLLEAGADADEFNADPMRVEEVYVLPAMHQAARRMCSGQMANLLLKAGSDPSATLQGVSAYALARAYGNTTVADAIVRAGGSAVLSEQEAILAVAAEGDAQEGVFVDPAELSPLLRGMVRELVSMPDTMAHIKRLIALGLEYDRGDDHEDVTPVQIAGWEGLPEMMAYFISLRPDLSHINGHGGTLLSTIVHGSENCPARENREHVACARMVLEHGVALPKWAISMAGDEAMLGFLMDWATAHPGQVTEG